MDHHVRVTTAHQVQHQYLVTVFLRSHLAPSGTHFPVSIGQLKQVSGLIVGDGVQGSGVRGRSLKLFFASLVEMLCKLNFVFFLQFNVVFDKVRSVPIFERALLGVVIFPDILILLVLPRELGFVE